MEVDRVVADTMIFLEASISDSNVSSSFLRRIDAGDAVLCTSRQLMNEIRDVLTRPALRLKNARLTDEALEEFFANMEQKAVYIDSLPAHFRLERDPKDEHLLNLAIEANARWLVTHDRDLLDLMDEVRPEAQSFRASHPGI